MKETFFSFKSHWENIENSVKLYSDNDSSENNEVSISDRYEWIWIKNPECSELQGPISDIDGHSRRRRENSWGGASTRNTRTSHRRATHDRQSFAAGHLEAVDCIRQWPPRLIRLLASRSRQRPRRKRRKLRGSVDVSECGRRARTSRHHEAWITARISCSCESTRDPAHAHVRMRDFARIVRFQLAYAWPRANVRVR